MDYAILKEAAFLQGARVQEPTTRAVVGQHRDEYNGVLKAIVPVFEDVPNIPQALSIQLDTQKEILELAAILQDRKATVILGPVFGYGDFGWTRVA